jgi:hypothetical protein
MTHLLNPWPAPCSPQFAAERTKLLFSCFRKNEASDAATFVTAVAAVLARYPEDIARRVTHPVDGLPGKSNFPPSVAEVRAACEAAMKPIYELQRVEREKARTATLLAPPVVTAEQRERATRRWFDEIRPSMIPAARQTETREQAAEKLMGIAGMSAEDFAKIPDAKPRTTFQPLKEPTQ